MSADSTVAHTPGKWVAVICETVEDARDESAFDWLSDEEMPSFLPLGVVWQDTGTGHTGLPGHVETTAANARLIAAAPELLEAAETVLEGLNARIDAACADGGASVPVFSGMAALSDAIHKARGGNHA